MANTNNPMEHAAAIMNPIYNASGGAITSAAYIYDEALGKTQAQINEDIQISESIESITEYYAAYEFSVYGDGSDNDGIKRDPDVNWIQIPNPEGKVIPDLTANKPYLWNYEIFHMSGNKTIETSAKVIGIFSNGRGILEIKRYYLVNDDGINLPLSSDPGWALQSPPTTEKNRFLWEKQCIWYTDDPNKEKDPEIIIRLIGVMGNPGIDGSDTEYIYIRSKEFKNPENPTPEDWNSETSNYQTTTDYIPEFINEDGLEWTDNPIGTSDVYPYEWVAVRKIKRGEKLWGKFSDPALWSKYGVTGNGILGIKKFYQISSVSSTHPDIPTSDIPSGWEDIKNLDNLGAWTSVSPATNKDAMYLWELEITYFTLLEYSYSCKLVGRMGDPGIDGTMIEYIYKTSTSETDIPNNPTPDDWETNTEYQKSDWTDETNGWFDEPSGINETDICEWTCIREYDRTNSRWGEFVGPKLWARYGKTGTSIVSVKTWYLKSDSSVLTEDIENANTGETETGDIAHTWYKSSPALTYDHRYLWKKSVTKYSAEIDDPDTLQDETKTDTIIKYEMIGTLGEKGVDGNLVDYIYALTPAFDRPNVPEIPSNRIPLSGSFEVNDPSQGTNEDGTYPIVTWTDDPQDMSEEYSYLWICYAEYDQESKTWGNYKKVTLWGKYGKDGQPGINGVSPNAAYKSTCFTRSNKTPDRPSATGSYSSPWPEDTRDDGTLIWSDEIPSGQEKLWAITRVFSTDGKDPQQPEWSEPKQLTDNSTTEYMYSAWAEKDELKLDYDGILFSKDPETDEINGSWYTIAKSKGWYDDPEQCLLEDGTNAGNSRVIWMATSICNNGTWSDWDIVKIKGEKGDSGTSIKIKKSYSSLELFEADWKNEDGSWKSPEENGYTDDAAFVVILEDGLGYLYVWDGDSWNNVGQFKGDPGESSYLHVKYANPGISGQNNSFTAIVGGETVYLIPTDSDKSETPGRFIGTCVDNNEDDPAINSSVYTWVKWQGEDGYGYEYIYTLTDSYEAPKLPETNDQADGYIPEAEGWYDDPLDTDETNPYCWQCYRQKVDGTWSDWKGSKNNPGYAVLWSKYGLDGNGLINKTIHYLISDSNISSSIESITAENNETNPSTFSPNTWYLVSPSVDKTYKFLWKRTVEEYLRKLEEIGNDTITKYELIGTRGDDGVDGSDIEWAYKLTKTNVAPNSDDDDWPEGEEVTSNSELGEWTDDAQDVSNEWPYQWYIKRTKEPGSNSWGPWGKLNGSVYQASIYRVFGKGIKTVYAYYKTSETSTSPEIPDKTGLSIASYLSLLEDTSSYNWSSDGSGLTIDSTNRYLWELTIFHYTDDTYDVQGPVEKASLTDGSIKSIVFCRKNGIPSRPEGGSYENPLPEDDGNNWEDGIPSGTYPIWSSARTFYIDGSHDGERKTYWSDPQQMTSTSDMEIQWSDVETNPGNPSNNPGNWTDTVDYSKSETIIWMATRIIKDGEAGNWVVTKIKGETGNPGTIYEIVTTPSQLYFENQYSSKGLDVKVRKTSGDSTETISSSDRLTELGLHLEYKVPDIIERQEFTIYSDFDIEYEGETFIDYGGYTVNMENLKIDISSIDSGEKIYLYLVDNQGNEKAKSEVEVVKAPSADVSTNLMKGGYGNYIICAGLENLPSKQGVVAISSTNLSSYHPNYNADYEWYGARHLKLDSTAKDQYIKISFDLEWSNLTVTTGLETPPHIRLFLRDCSGLSDGGNAFMLSNYYFPINSQGNIDFGKTSISGFCCTQNSGKVPDSSSFECHFRLWGITSGWVKYSNVKAESIILSLEEQSSIVNKVNNGLNKNEYPYSDRSPFIPHPEDVSKSSEQNLLDASVGGQDFYGNNIWIGEEGTAEFGSEMKITNTGTECFIKSPILSLNSFPTPVTLSFEAKLSGISSPQEFKVYISKNEVNSLNPGIYYTVKPKVNVWTRITTDINGQFLTAWPKLYQDGKLQIRFDNAASFGSGATLHIRNVKLEEGYQPTGYTISENDKKGIHGFSYRPCGTWNDNTTYEADDNVRDVVWYDGKHYVCKITNYNKRPDNYSDHWEASEKFNFLSVEALFANEVWSSAISSEIGYFDGLTAGNVNISGNITAESGNIGGYSIAENELNSGIGTSTYSKFSPKNLTIQNTETSGAAATGNYFTISLGQNAASSGNNYGTALYVHKSSNASLDSIEVGSEPAAIIESVGINVGGKEARIALMTRGSIISSGAMIEIGTVISDSDIIILDQSSVGLETISYYNLTINNKEYTIFVNNSYPTGDYNGYTSYPILYLPQISDIESWIKGGLKIIPEQYSITLKFKQLGTNKVRLAVAKTDNNREDLEFWVPDSTPDGGSMSLNNSFILQKYVKYEVSLIRLIKNDSPYYVWHVIKEGGTV